MKLKFYMLDIVGIGALIIIFLLLAWHQYVFCHNGQIPAAAAPSTTQAPGSANDQLWNHAPSSDQKPAPANGQAPGGGQELPAAPQAPVQDDEAAAESFPAAAEEPEINSSAVQTPEAGGEQ
jgi:hypothetical protein